MYNKLTINNVKKDLENNIISVIYSQPGKGIVSDLHELATEMQTEAFELRCAMLSNDFEVKNATAGAIEYASRHQNENPILIIDDINQSTPNVLNELINICLTKNNIPNNLRIVITCVMVIPHPFQPIASVFHCHFNNG